MAVTVSLYSGETVAVMGLGRSGMVAAQALLSGGADVRGWDDDAARRDAAGDQGIPIADLTVQGAFDDTAALVLSPGIPHTYPAPNPVAAAAKASRCPIIGDIDLLARSCPAARYVGVTGTNGKSTTTALIGHILVEAGMPVQVGGNLGAPALGLDPQGKNGTYVLEMSSYQLELSPNVTFDVAVLLNVAEDHLDRHGGMDGYIAAKKRIFQGPPGVVVIGVDDVVCRSLASQLAEQDLTVIPVSVQEPIKNGVFVQDGCLMDASGPTPRIVLRLEEAAALPGTHNAQNAGCAYAAARALGIDDAAIADAIRSYPGLRHRQQLVAVIDGTAYVNDSKATNAEAAARALACYDPIYWIAGGRAKQGGFGAVEDRLGTVRQAFLIGEAMDELDAALASRVPCTRSGTLKSAVAAAQAAARADAGKDPVVLLSPACASFDQFTDFEDRGDAFCRLVAALPGQSRDFRETETSG